MHLIEALHQLDALLKKSRLQFEIYGTASKGLEIEAKQGKVQYVEQSRTQGLALRLFQRKKNARNGRFGFAYCTDFQPRSLKTLIERAQASLSVAPFDPAIRLPECCDVPFQDLELYDPQYANFREQEKIDCALELERSAKSCGRKIKAVEAASYSEEISETILRNSVGMELKEKETAFFVSLQAIADDGKDSTSAFDFQYAPTFAGLKAAKLAKHTAMRAIESLGATSLASGPYPVVVENRAVCDLLDCVIPAFSAEAVQKHSSFLDRKIGKKIFADLIHLTDDATLPGKLGSYAFDGEGVAGGKTVLVEDGKLKSLLYDSYRAQKDRTKSTGNAIRGDLRALPHIESSNLCLKPGKSTNLLAAMERGVWIRELLGLHTANPVSGDFSFGAAGFFVEKGEIAYPVHNLTFSGNLFTLLSQVEELGQDLIFSGAFAAPSIAFAKLVLGGKG